MKRTLNIILIPALLLCCFAFYSPPDQTVGLSTSGQTIDSTGYFIDSLLRSRPDLFCNILKNIDKYEVQIIYTQVDRDTNNKPSLKHYTYRLGKDYFYPASLVKLPTSLIALQELNRLSVPRNAIMLTDSSKQCPFYARIDSTSENAWPSAEQYIKRMLLVSDNFAFNRMYELVGQEKLNTELRDKGYKDARIIHSFDGSCNGGKFTNGVSFINEKGDTLYYHPDLINDREYDNPRGKVLKGKAYYDNRNKLIKQPKDFTYMNYLPLDYVHNMVISIMFPPLVPEENRFDITDDDYKFLRRYMCMLPRESSHPKYDPKKYGDSYKKYLLFGASHDSIDTDSIRIFNIVGQSYGNLIDCAYIVDFKNNTEFFLSAAIYVNSDGVLNDGKYDYKTVGFPFLTNLGTVMRDYEQKRTREHIPDLSEFRMIY